MTANLSLVRGKAVRTVAQVLIFLLTMAQLTLHAQGMGSGIQGSVRDSSGAVIPGATIAVTSTETNLQRSVTSNSAGLFAVPDLSPGKYRVQVSMQGFQGYIREDIELVVGQQLVLNTILQVGNVAEQVTVTGEMALVDTSTAQVAGLVAERQVKDLPLNGRSFDNLITLNPGTVNTTAAVQGVSSSTGTGNYFSIGGRRPGENLFLWNGVEYPGGTSASSSTPGGISGQLLGIDAVREFNVTPNTDSAEFGHRAGGQVGVVTQSGSNVLHGSLFEFLRNDKLDARNFFDRGSIPPFKRNQFGGSGGGPIKKDKTFVFGNYEGFRQRLGLSRVAIVPDAQTRQGLLPNATTGVYEPVVGFNPAVKPYFGLWPDPGQEITTAAGLPTGTAYSFSNPASPIREDFGIVRGDQTFSDRDTLSGSYTADDGASIQPQSNPLSTLTLAQRTQLLSLSEVHIFSPNVINNFTAGFSRAHWRFQYSVSITPSGAVPLLVGRPVGQLNIGGNNGNTVITNAGAGPNTGHDQLNIDNIFSYTDQMHINKGIHSIALGAWAERLQSNENNGNFGNWQFPSLIAFMQGKPTSLNVQDAMRVPWRVWMGAWFVQDSIKLRSNLTLSVGLRHEFTNGWNALDGRAGNFIQGPGGVLENQLHFGDNLLLKNRATRLFGPRFAVAWDPFGKGKTSIRAGWGLMYNMLDNIGWCCRNMLPIAASYQLNSTPQLQIPFPLQVPAASQIPAALNPVQGGGSGGIQTDPYTPTVFNYRFEVEQALSGSMTLRLAYIGSRGYHEIQRADANTAFPVILANGTKFFPCPGGAATCTAATRRNTHFGSQAEFFTSAVNSANMFYVDLNRRFRSGLAFRANYTYGCKSNNGRCCGN